ncbi:MAG: porin, partial [Sphingobacteriales bacterium]
NYSQGALKYIFQTPNSNWGFVDGDSVTFGPLSDAVFAGSIFNNTATDLELTTAWNVNAAYEHFWNPRWRTSLYGGYAQVSYDDAANGILCLGIGAGNGANVGGVAVATPGCDMNWNTWWVGSRTQWNVTKDFYMGVDVLYQRLEGASTFNGLSTAGISSAPSPGVARFIDTSADNFSVRFRVHRDFYP